MGLSGSLPVSLVRLIAPERCVMSAETFLLALLMWQFEGCDYAVSQVTASVCRGGLYSVCLTHVVSETKTQLTMLVCKVMQCLQCCVWKCINQYIVPSANLFALFFSQLKLLSTQFQSLFLLIWFSDLIFSRFY